MIMMRFRKEYNFKIICLIVSIVVLFNYNAYSKDGLRLSLGNIDDTFDRIELAELIQVFPDMSIDPLIVPKA